MCKLNAIDTIESLIKEKVVCLCSNCHKTLHATNFYKYLPKILKIVDEVEYKTTNLQNDSSLLFQNFKKIKSDVENFRFSKLNNYNPLDHKLDLRSIIK